MKDYRKVHIYPRDNGFPVFGEFDVLVCGGGAAGVAAATTAAEFGLKTLLIEKYGFLGGAATAGYSGTICGLFYADEDPLKTGPRQAVYGFADRFYQELRARHAITEPQLYGKTYLLPFDPQVWKEAAEDIVLGSGTQILYHTSVVGVVMDGNEFLGVVIDTKAGIAQVLSKATIDATGDADLIYRAGLGYTKGDQGRVQCPTMIFRLAGVDVSRFKAWWGEDSIAPDKVTMLIRKVNEEEGASLPRLKGWVYPTGRPGELFMNVTMILGRDGRDLDMCDPEDHSEAEEVARKQVRRYAKFFKEHIPGCEESFVNDLSCEVGVRQTRSIEGVEQLRDADIEDARKRPDGITRCPWPIELHRGDAPYMHWLINDYYEVPYGAMVPKEGEGLIVAGRDISAEHHALASCRVTAQCFGYGQAAACACKTAIESNRRFREIKGEEIREILNALGAGLD